MCVIPGMFIYTADQTVWYGLVTFSLLTKNKLPATTPALYKVTVFIILFNASVERCSWCVVEARIQP
jgi:hypothetical protein